MWNYSASSKNVKSDAASVFGKSHAFLWCFGMRVLPWLDHQGCYFSLLGQGSLVVWCRANSRRYRTRNSSRMSQNQNRFFIQYKVSVNLLLRMVCGPIKSSSPRWLNPHFSISENHLQTWCWCSPFTWLDSSLGFNLGVRWRWAVYMDSWNIGHYSRLAQIKL